MKHLTLKLTVLLVLGMMCAGAGTPLPAADDIVYRIAVELVKVERTPDLPADFENKIRGRRLWADDMFDTAWSGQESGFFVTFSNRKNEDLKITWQKSWIIDTKGKKRDIIAPSRIAGKTKDTKSSLVPAKGKLRITVMPKDYIADQAPEISIEGNMPVSGKSSWKFPVYKTNYTEKEVKKISKKEKKRFKKKYGDYSEKKFDFKTFIAEKTIEVTLALDINGNLYTYRFYFKPYVFNR